MNDRLASIQARLAQVGNTLEKIRVRDSSTAYLIESNKALEQFARLIKVVDIYTEEHGHEVGEMAYAVAKQLGLSESETYYAYVAGTLHDIGKMGVPHELLKAKDLTEEENALVQRHAQLGFEILNDGIFPHPIPEIVYQHHENLDGSGFPRQLKGDEILIQARIIHVIDMYNSRHCHHDPSIPEEDVMGFLEEHAGTMYDADVLRAFKQVLAQGV